MAQLAGRVLGGFVVEDEIGRGGMGVVLLARQQSLDRPVVLKKLRRELAEQPELCQRFEREARTAAALHHHNVVAVYDCFSHRGDRYIAQEYVDGIDLRSALAKLGCLPWRVAALVALEAARGLEAIHGAGTVHRDVKPANLLLGRRGEVKIADFGIALDAAGEALTRPGVLLGSPAYMPPEQLQGERLDARGDVFSLGVVLYELLAGRSPYPEPEPEDSDTWLSRMQKERYPPLRRVASDTPRWLARLVRRCLRARPRQRPASGAAVRRELERRLGHPSPADCRAELAGWLWERQVFEVRRDETVVLVAPQPERRRSLSWAATTAAACVLAASVLVIDVRPSGRDPDPAPSTAADAPGLPGSEATANLDSEEAPGGGDAWGEPGETGTETAMADTASATNAANAAEESESETDAPPAASP